MGTRINKLKEEKKSYKEIRQELINTVIFNTVKLQEFKENTDIAPVFDNLKKYAEDNYKSFNNQQLEYLANLTTFTYCLLVDKADLDENVVYLDKNGEKTKTITVNDKECSIHHYYLYSVLGTFYSRVGFLEAVDSFSLIPDTIVDGRVLNVDSNINIKDCNIKVFDSSKEGIVSYTRYMEWYEMAKQLSKDRRFIVFGQKNDVPLDIKDSFFFISFEQIINDIYRWFDLGMFNKTFETLDNYANTELKTISTYSIFEYKVSYNIDELKIEFNKAINYLALYSEISDAFINKIASIDLDKYDAEASHRNKATDSMNLVKLLCVVYGKRYSKLLKAEVEYRNKMSFSRIIRDIICSYEREQEKTENILEIVENILNDMDKFNNTLGLLNTYIGYLRFK